MTKDFKNLRRWTEGDEQSLERLMTRLTALCAMAVSAIALFMALTVAPATAITSATTDNLMSDDMASYTAIYGYHAVFEEGDME